MEAVNAAEEALSVAVKNLEAVARAAGYDPRWDIIMKKVGIKLESKPAEETPVRTSSRQQHFECVEVPTTSLLLAGAMSVQETWVRPGRKPIPRQEPGPMTENVGAHQPLQVAKPKKKRVRHTVHEQCHKCKTHRSGGSWRRSVLGVPSRTMCVACYGREARRQKKALTEHRSVPRPSGN
ncbi:hypothetical protein CF319_g5365 [Tilletia indica]|nr:hypothetical protein CF319_g5365 [Tilletia indica]